VGTVLNLNVPDVRVDQLLGLRPAALAAFGIVQTTITKHGEDHVQLAIADNGEPAEPGTDAAFLIAGYATVTSIRAVCEADQGPLAELATDAGVWTNGPTAAHARKQGDAHGRRG